MGKRICKALVLVLLSLPLLSCEQITQMITPDPTAPGSMSASQGTYADKIVLSWNPASNADSYRIFVATAPNGQFTRLSGETSDSSVDITGVEPNSHYFYKVAGVNSANEQGPFSTTVEGWASLPAPTSVAASQGTYGDKIVLSWAAVTGAYQYFVYESGTASGTYAKLTTTTDITETSVNITGTTPNTHYFYKVSAADALDNEGSLSASAEGWAALMTIQWDEDGEGYYQLFTNQTANYGTFYYRSNTVYLSQGSNLIVDTKKMSGAASQDYGVIFYYVDSSNFYYLGIDTQSRWCLWEKWGGVWSLLQPWTTSSALLAGNGTLNTIKVHYWYDSSQARYEHEFYFNGTNSTWCLYGSSTMYGKTGFGVQVGLSGTESFPGTPVDVRFKMTSPSVLPDAVGQSLRSVDADKDALSAGAGDGSRRVGLNL
jgi:hypothetical protein